MLYFVFGGEQEVNSFHHQAVKDPGRNVTITAYSEDDAPEGIEVRGGAPFVAGVQWHLEEMTGSEAQMNLFRKFIEVCQNNFSLK